MAPAHDSANVETLLEGSSFAVENVLKTFREDDSFNHTAIVKSPRANAQHSFRNLQSTDKSRVVLEGTVADEPYSGWEDKCP